MYYMQRESTGKGSQPRLGPSTEPLLPGAPNDNFRKISVRKTIWDLEFSEHLLQNFLLACLS